MKNSRSKIKKLIAGVLPLLAAEIAWTVTYCAVRAVRDLSCGSGDCPTDDPAPVTE